MDPECDGALEWAGEGGRDEGGDRGKEGKEGKERKERKWKRKRKRMRVKETRIQQFPKLSPQHQSI